MKCVAGWTASLHTTTQHNRQPNQSAVPDHQTISCRLENIWESMMVENHFSYNDIANILLHPKCYVQWGYLSNAYLLLSCSPTTTDWPSRCKQPSYYYWPGCLSGSNLGMFQLFLLRSEQLLSTPASDSVILLLVHHQLLCWDKQRPRDNIVLVLTYKSVLLLQIWLV